MVLRLVGFSTVYTVYPKLLKIIHICNTTYIILIGSEYLDDIRIQIIIIGQGSQHKQQLPNKIRTKQIMAPVITIILKFLIRFRNK